MNSNISYKQIHEGFMQNLNGTTIWENISIIAPVPMLAYFIVLFKYCVLDSILLRYNVKRKYLLVFLTEFLFMVCFLTLQFTLLSNYIHIMAFLFTIAFMTAIICCWKKTDKSFFFTPQKRNDLRPYLTYFRSIVSIMSCICILAVDFHIFPRRLAKTETFGYGLMDTGVGFYIVANGIVIKQSSMRNALSKSLLSSLPIISLGIIRFLSVETLNYQKHVTEYGLHWNFFFTLAFVKIVAACLIHIFPRRIVLLALTTALIHQIMLSCVSEKWVLEHSIRNTIITANKEGLVSIPGYVSLYLCSVALGKFLNMSNPRIVDDFRHGINNLLWSVIFLVITLAFRSVFDVSRRLANITYITWILSMSLFGLSISIFSVTALRFTLPMATRNDEPLLVPNIFQAVNYNNLFYFIISNLLTGVINLMFKTLYADNLFSIFLLILYQFFACGIVYLLYICKMKIKFW